jgi:hypothetical protein
MTLNIITFIIINTWHNDIQHNDIQQAVTQHNVI